MKNEAIGLLFTILLISLVSAKSTCSDNSFIVSDQKEINIFSSRSINGLGIGVVKTDEVNLLRRIIADLIVDSTKLTLSNKTNSQEIELLSGKHTVNLLNATDTTATISVDGESKDITLQERDSIKDLTIVLAKSSLINGERTIEVTIGKQLITLSNYEKPYEKFTFGNTTYVVELFSASRAVNAIVIVSYCKTGDIIAPELPKKEVKNETNKTVENSTNNKDNNKTEEKNTTQISVAEVNAKNNNVSSNETNKSVGTEIEKTDNKEEAGFFKGIWKWIKNLFGF